jgi:DHA1 family multidrug resistance protein-like MFS transporter
MRSRPFIVLFISDLVANMGISMVSPLLPVYAKDLGASGIWIGLTFSIFAVSQTAISPFAGGWSDRHGRKPFIIAGLLLYFVAALGYLTAGTFLQVLAFRLLSGFGTSLIFSVARAYIGDIVPEGHEGRWFGVFATADVIGFGSGPIFAGTIRQVFGFSSVFIGMALLMGSAAAIVAVLLPAHTATERAAGVVGQTTDALGSLRALRDRMVFALTFLMALQSLIFGATLSFLGVRLENLGVDAVLVGLAFSMQSLASGVSQPIAGYLADVGSRLGIVLVGLLMAAVSLFALGIVTHLGVIYALLFVAGLGSSAAMVGAGAMQVAVGRRVGMGTVLGLGSAGNGIGVIFGSVVGGFVVGLFNAPAAAFEFGAVVMLLGIPVFVWMTRGRPEVHGLPAVEPAAALVD